jgi:hypothetical protein
VVQCHMFISQLVWIVEVVIFVSALRNLYFCMSLLIWSDKARWTRHYCYLVADFWTSMSVSLIVVWKVYEV